MYLFRAVDSHGQTVDFYLSETRDRESAKIFLKRALANPIIVRPTCLPETVRPAITPRFESCRAKANCISVAGTRLTVTTRFHFPGVWPG